MTEPHRLRLATLVALTFATGCAIPEAASTERTTCVVSVWVDPAVREEPVTGRVFFLVTDQDREPRRTMMMTFAYYFNAPRFPYPPGLRQGRGGVASGHTGCARSGHARLSGA